MTDDNVLTKAIIDLNESEVQTNIRRMVDSGTDVNEILRQCHEGMAVIGERFDDGACFIPELIIAGKIMENVMDELEPLILRGGGGGNGTERGCAWAETVIMGTVKNDVHNIGKDIVTMMLRGSGFNVIDLGVDVAPEHFVNAAREHKASVIGMSILLTTCYKSVTETVQALSEAGMRDSVRVMLGGAAASEPLRQRSGCDHYGPSAIDAVKFVKSKAQA